MRSASLSGARVVLLAGPTGLAFFNGGFFDEARAWAGLGVWLLVLAGLALRSGAVPRGRNALIALGGLGLLAAWTLLSLTWAPLAGNAYHAGQIVVLYLGTALAAVVLFSGASPLALIDPLLAAGALVVTGYGVSERLAPGVLHFARSVSAQGRLEQPLSYWNAMGELAAIGLVLCARLAGDGGRSPRLRASATAASALLGMGLYVSFSRGALFACAAGLITVVTASGRREQLRATLLCVAVAAGAAAASAPFGGVTSLAGSLSTRETQGAVVFVLLVVVALIGASAQLLLIRRERPGRLKLPRRAPQIALVAVAAGLALAIAVGSKESSAAPRPLPGGATRLETLQSNRYAYWKVALRAFGQQPLHGVGAGGWSVYWLRWRTVNEFAQDAHSLPLQVLAELGVVGLALLAVFLAGVARAAAQARRLTALAIGPSAGFVAYIAHAPLDWDWQMPAVTMTAMIMAGALLAIGEAPRPGPAGALAKPLESGAA
ncbi:MAG: O-antigen ligase family protein [Solirubrobacteraceae bacterium]